MSSKLELSWPEECQHVIFRELGTHYIRQGQYTVATSNFAKASKANPGAVECHYRRSVAQFRNSELKDALASARAGLAVERDEQDLRGRDFDCSLQECKTAFELDRFEEHVKVASNSSPAFGGHRLKDIQAEIRLAHRNYENALGDRAGPCLYQQRNRLKKIAVEREAAAHVETRPSWKIKRDRKECDAVSVAEVVIKQPHIREKKRKEKNLKVLGQAYLNRGWKDLEFISSLRKGGAWEHTVNLSQAQESSKKLSDTIEKCYERVDSALISMQSRTPYSTYRNNRFGSAEDAKLSVMDTVFKARYQTYRDVLNQLDHMHELRKQGNLEMLRIYVGDVLWDYYQIKTERVFPDRYKYVNEVCNLVGLAITDGLQISPVLMDEPLKERLAVLFDLPIGKDEEEVVVPIFGDKSTYRDPAAPDYGYIAYKNRISRLEKRVPYSRYPIERAFLYHEMCRHHLDAGKLDETRIMARKVIDEATQSGSPLWKFLGVLAIVKADAQQMNLDRLVDSLEEAEEAVLPLEDERLQHVVQVAKLVNNSLIKDKNANRRSFEINRIQLS
ncbi:uncharacterized protein LOC120426652 [Culex pipiens pallens]|uniref:uncharacterized protein LOC120426652 n=1 Tax=Culex pipiens pallens TaxID=42434 RepID=UPI001953E55A|nr:uncharacterized protein LOC120426652 [Culex pipiens pallens]